MHAEMLVKGYQLLVLPFQFDIVCDSSWIHELIDPVYLIGMGAGAFASGFLSDM